GISEESATPEVARNAARVGLRRMFQKKGHTQWIPAIPEACSHQTGRLGNRDGLHWGAPVMDALRHRAARRRSRPRRAVFFRGDGSGWNSDFYERALSPNL